MIFGLPIEEEDVSVKCSVVIFFKSWKLTICVRCWWFQRRLEGNWSSKAALLPSLRRSLGNGKRATALLLCWFSDGCSYYYRSTVAIAVQHWILLWKKLQPRRGEKTHMTWFFLFSSWKTWWRHASTSTLWTIFLRRQMTFLKPLQTYTHESESRILTDSQ